jgi:hypothetical protein
MRPTGLTNNITVLDGKIIEPEIVKKKMLHVAPEPLEQVTISIEMPLDLDNRTVEEVTGHLQNIEQWKKGTISDKQGRLLLTEEWRVCMRSRNNSGTGGLGGGENGKKQAEKKDSIDGPVPGKCLNCGKKGHWAKDC